MGIFNSLFGNKDTSEKKEEKQLPWIPLTSLDQLEEIASRSKKRTQMIFKHSKTCGISRMVITMFGNDFDFKENQVDLYYLDLHSFRDVSNEVSYRFQVLHQSPQLLIIKNGLVVAHDSHGAITSLDLKRFA